METWIENHIIDLITVSFSVGTLISTQRHKNRSTKEEQFRLLLRPHVTQLGEELHNIVAMSNVACKRFLAGKDIASDVDKIRLSSQRLEELRRKVRYPLKEIDLGIRDIIRLPGWFEHAKSDNQRRTGLLEAADKLKSALDDAIRQSYIDGVPPSDKFVKAVDKSRLMLRRFGDAKTEDNDLLVEP